MRPIDPTSPLPLYHQIADRIRARIQSGDLRTGDLLPSMRQAASDFDVNLHTVRHAYLALCRDGLVEMNGAKGTRVVSTAVPPTAAPARSRTEFLRSTLHEAATAHHLSPAQLITALRSHTSGSAATTKPTIAVIECSEWQCRQHAEELEARFDLHAIPHPVHQASPPDADFIVATWFHYNDIRRDWPALLNRIDFVTIRPDLTHVLALASDSLWVVERDEATVGAVAGDLLAALDADHPAVQPHVAPAPETALEELPGKDPILFAPRVWADLTPAARDHARAFELRYSFDSKELESVADRSGWQPCHNETPTGP